MAGERPLRLLALDGGGVRGLSSLVILERLMYQINADPEAHVSDYFDMIAGTSTGGIIAIMLGRLNMTVRECIDAYSTLSKTIFEKSPRPGFWRFTKKVLGLEQFRSEKLESAILTVMDAYLSAEEKEGTQLKHIPLLSSALGGQDICKIFVIATQQSDGHRCRLRNYRSLEEIDQGFTIVEAALATSAAPLIFNPLIKKRGDVEEKYVDGGMGYNNPTEQLLIECQDVWPGRDIGCIVSVGTGCSRAMKVGKRLTKVAEKCANIATNADKLALDFSQNISRTRPEISYYRFTVGMGLENARLHEWEAMGDIRQRTGTYLDGREQYLKECVKRLKEIAEWQSESGLGEQVLSGKGPKLSDEQRGAKTFEKFQIYLICLLIATECLRTLSFPELDRRQNDVAWAREGTLEWIWEGQFRDWVNRGNGIFYISGKPGSGKSTLMKQILQRLLEQNDVHGRDLVVSFFFSDRGTTLEKTREGFLRTLIVYILQHTPKLFSHILPEYKKQKDRQDGITWHPNFLQNLLLRVLAAPSAPSVFLIIDALDECQDDTMPELLSLLSKLDSPKICISSRSYTTIPQYLGHNVHRLVLENETVNDISQYVRDEMGKLRGHDEGTDEEIEALENEIIAMADGVFLWVVLVVKRLVVGDHVGHSIAQLQEELSNIPPDLSGLFRKILVEIKTTTSNDKIQVAINMFRWVLFAERPLTLTEFRYALAFGLPNKFSSQKDMRSSAVVQDDRRLERLLISGCGGLLEAKGQGDKKFVQLIHQSTKDFLLTDEGLSILNAEKSFGDIVGEAHDYLANTCITYLTITELNAESGLSILNPIWKDKEFIQNNVRRLETEYPFLRYAANSWMEHAENAEQYQVDQTQNIEKFGWPTKEFFKIWVQLDNLFNHYDNWGYEVVTWLPGTAPFHVASEYNLILYLKNLSNLEVIINEQGGRTGNALSGAAAGGRDTVIKLLLDRGADGNAKNNTGQTALYFAASGGHESTAQLLLDQGIDMSAKTNDGLTLLHSAAREGHEEMALLLLNQGANKEAKDEQGQTALHLAAAGGHRGVVKLLLSQGANRDVKDNNGWSLLHSAALGGRDEILQLLLDQGIDRDAKDESGQTALHHAAFGGNEGTIQLLLEYGIDKEAKDEDGWTALHAAADAGNQETLQQLLNQGADKEARNNDGWTTLHFAVDQWHEEIVRLLLDQGASKEARTNDEKTALDMAIEEEQEAILQLLMN